MPFLQDDYYLTRGGGKLLHGSDWKEDVYKFDASSFYNWEQDNLPIYDLEDRTEMNWEQHGYPGSSINGIELVVSGTGNDGKQVFSDLSGALNALPRTIRFPVIIEVAASGDLGEIEISDFEFSESGGLEIINRCFAKVMSGSSTGTYDMAASATNNTSSISTLSSIELSTTLTDTSAMAVSAAIPPANFNSHHRIFARMADMYDTGASSSQINYGTPGVENSFSRDLRPHSITVSKLDGAATIIGTGNRIELPNAISDTAFDYYKTAPSYGMRDVDLTTTLATAFSGKTARISGFMYANSMTKLTVKNCNGPIYIRGFCVDSNGSHDDALTVKNSNVVIENCSVMRGSRVGAKFINSDVTLNRGFTSYRNYNSTASLSAIDAFGIQSFDSTITLSGANDVSAGLGVDSPFTVSHNRVGIQLNNSTLKTPWGGRGYNLAGAAVTDAEAFRQLYLDVMLNYGTGMEINSSNLDMYHTLMVYQNLNGIKAKDSSLVLDELVCDHNEKIGLDAENSTVEYYRTYHGNTNSPNMVLSFLKNGQNMRLVNSTFKESDFDTMSSNVMNNFQIEGVGYDKINNSTTPGVVLKNSVCRLLAVESYNGATESEYSTTETPVLGSAYRADSNSYLKFMGLSGHATGLTSSGATYITGPSSNYENKLHTVAVYANNDSTVEFTGPTVLTNAGINVGANNRSSIRFLASNENGVIQPTKFGLSDPETHTRVMAQAFRSCFVVNNNSTLEIKDCGDYKPYWSKSADTYVTQDLILSSTYNPNDAQGISQYVSGGFVQFFPNPILDHSLSSFGYAPRDSEISNFDTLSYDASNLPTFTASDYYNYSQGGYCVKADKGSQVKVKNVHFPCGFPNPSSTILDVSAGASSTLCGKTFIWGIGDDSRLYASHIVVSGNYPEDVPYNGPSGIYVSAGECDGVFSNLSAAPSSTPDTGRLSIMDSFGVRPAYSAGGGVSAIDAVTTPQNKGPFRIYFSVNPVAKFIGYTRGTNGAYQVSSNLDAGYVWDYPPSAVEVGEPYQELAQGYNPSRDCSTPSPSTLSSIHQELAFQNPIYQPLSSTFFYASGMLDPSYVSRIWLDDSAMNTFANAKNATKGTSGRPRLVSYFRATTNKYGEGFPGSTSVDAGGYREDYGLGFKSSNIFDFEDNV